MKATASLIVTALAASGAAGPAAARTEPWPVAGRQGVIQVVIVPGNQARDREAYTRQIALLCAPQSTCFINFFTNSTGAPVAVPLPDEIAQESTAVFRRSVKQGGEYFRWSCRMGIDAGNCF
ncbi:hypothetical protein V4F39_11270 [Aquincola sp. MAHUQ-54]|uniref:DUF4189 domain-containing protein n=1 Tax=Aquincola agrisoli TaxID=3119538 RepID=A0AAW9QFP8_9BURK